MVVPSFRYPLLGWVGNGSKPPRGLDKVLKMLEDKTVSALDKIYRKYYSLGTDLRTAVHALAVEGVVNTIKLRGWL